MSVALGPRHRVRGVHSPLYSSSASALGWLSYLRPTSARPVSHACEPPPGTPWESADYDPYPVRIENIRLRATRPHIDREGFELWHAPSATRNFLDDDEVRATYYPEVAELALAATGATRAHVFDHLVRRREAGRPLLGFGRSSGRGPVAANVAPADLVEGEVRYANRVGEIYLLRHSPRHRWFFASALEPQEALVFKQYDSRTDGIAHFTPHSAFDQPVFASETPLRESIEARVLVVYE